MTTKSTHTQHSRQRHYVPGSSRGTRSATTLLAQVADIERGTRIRERREELHLTQPAVVDLLEEAAKALPRSHDLHPSKLGKAPVTLRGYQTYEQGGGIVWEKAKLLAGVLQMDVQAMMSGPVEGDRVPTPFAGQDALADRFDALEQRVTDQLAKHAREVEALLARQSRILASIEARLREQQTVRDEVSDLIEARGREIVEGRPAVEPDPQPVPRQTSAAKTKRAAKPRTA